MSAKLSLVLLLFTFFVSCNESIFVPEIEPEHLSDWRTTIPDYAKNNIMTLESGLDINVSGIGNYHNEVLEELVGKVQFASCTKIETMELIQLIKSTKTFQKMFSTAAPSEEGLDGIFSDYLNICNATSGDELFDLVGQSILHQLQRIKDAQVIPEKEMTFIENFTSVVLSSKEKVDIQEFYQAWNDIDDKYMNGVFSLTLLTIYEYSSNFWSAYFDNMSTAEIQSRVYPAIIMIALVDLGGSYVAGMIWIYNNIDCVSCGDPNEFLNALGHAAVTTSAGVLGPLVDEVFFSEG